MIRAPKLACAKRAMRSLCKPPQLMKKRVRMGSVLVSISTSPFFTRSPCALVRRRISPSFCSVLDGVYRTTEGVPVFHAVRPPTAEELQALLSRIIRRIMQLLTRKGYLIEEQGMIYLLIPDPDMVIRIDTETETVEAL